MPDHKPRDHDFENRTRRVFDAQNAMKHFAITISSVGPGWIELDMPFSDDLTQHHGFMHAGVITTAMDTACGCAAFTLMEKDDEVLTVEFKSNFLSPAKGDRFLFRAEIIKSGRTISVANATAYAITDATQKPIATMTATLMALKHMNTS